MPAIGLSHLPAFDSLIASRPDLVEMVEVEPQAYWLKAPGAGSPPRGNALVLDDLAALPQPKLLHGIGAPLGGLHCDQAWHVAEFRHWATALDVGWVSEHLSVTVTDAGDCGFLMPPAQSDAGVALAARNIRARAATLGLPVAFETGVNYFPVTMGEMPDGDWFTAVADAADCGIVLDLHNLWCNERNGRASVAAVLARLPLSRVREVHVAGGRAHGAWWLDAHSGAVPGAVLGILADVLPDLPNAEAVIFEIGASYLPAFGLDAAIAEIERLHNLRARVGSVSRRPRGNVQAPASDSGGGPRPAEWETGLAAGLAEPVTPAFELYAELVRSFRAGAVADLLARTIRLIALRLGRVALDALIADYAAACPPARFPSDEALQFAAWLGARSPVDPCLADLLAFEAGLVHALTTQEPVELRLARDLSRVIAAIDDGVVPDVDADGPYDIVIG